MEPDELENLTKEHSRHEMQKYRRAQKDEIKKAIPNIHVGVAPCILETRSLLYKSNILPATQDSTQWGTNITLYAIAHLYARI